MCDVTSCRRIWVFPCNFIIARRPRVTHTNPARYNSMEDCHEDSEMASQPSFDTSNNQVEQASPSVAGFVYSTGSLYRNLSLSLSLSLTHTHTNGHRMERSRRVQRLTTAQRDSLMSPLILIYNTIISESVFKLISPYLVGVSPTSPLPYTCAY